MNHYPSCSDHVQRCPICEHASSYPADLKVICTRCKRDIHWKSVKVVPRVEARSFSGHDHSWVCGECECPALKGFYIQKLQH